MFVCKFFLRVCSSDISINSSQADNVSKFWIMSIQYFVCFILLPLCNVLHQFNTYINKTSFTTESVELFFWELRQNICNTAEFSNCRLAMGFAIWFTF